MALIFSDEFSGTPGTFPAGWTNENVTNTATITNTGYHGNSLIVPIQGQLRNSLGGHQTNMTIFYVGRPNVGFGDGHGPSVSGVQQVGTSTVYSNIFSIGFTLDYGVGASDLNGRLICEGGQHSNYFGEQRDPWSFIQADITISATTIGTASALAVGATMRVNGEVVATGTGSFLSALGAYVDFIRINGAGNVPSGIDELYVYSPAVGAPIVTPNQGTAINARVSQALVEHLTLPSASNARITQAAIEHLDLPSSGNARVSQAVIELIMTQEGGGWIVYEA
jgi:hypothetical protein